MSGRARELAALFDRSFAEPMRLDRTKGPIALRITAGGAPYLLPLAEVTLVTRAPKIVPLPGGGPRQLGIAGIRGSLFTVLSLPALLGATASTGSKVAWVAVVRGVALGFDAVDGQIELEGAPPNLLRVDALLERIRTAP